MTNEPTKKESKKREYQEDNTRTQEIKDAEQIIKKVILFLQLFMCETLSKRVVSIILLAVGVPNKRITELTGMCDKSVRTLKKSLEAGEIDSLFRMGRGGRKRKLQGLEESIIEEIENNNYHSQQQIADMVEEQYGIKVSIPVIQRLLKKTKSNG